MLVSMELSTPIASQQRHIQHKTRRKQTKQKGKKLCKGQADHSIYKESGKKYSTQSSDSKVMKKHMISRKAKER